MTLGARARRGTLALVLAAGAAATHAGEARPRQTRPQDTRPQDTRPQQADGIVSLLDQLERAIERAEPDGLRAFAAAGIPESATTWFALVTRGGPGAGATVRERLRRADGAVFHVVADVFVRRDARGRIATWQITAVPHPSEPGRYVLSDLRELAAVDGLLRLTLDVEQAYRVKDLIVNAPDLAVQMSSGVAFAARSPGGITGLVVHGRGDVIFSPADPAEQLQVQRFSRRSQFKTEVRTLFVRVNPAEFAERVTTASLAPMRPTAADAARAGRVFADLASRSFTVDVRELSPERWSIEPPGGGAVIEFETGTHGWLTYTRSPSDDEDISLFHRASNRTVSLYASPVRAAERGRASGDADEARYDVLHYQVDATFDPSRLVVSGRARLSVRVLDRPIVAFMVRLAPSLVVTSVGSPELGELIALRVVGQNQLLVGLPGYQEPGTRLTLDFSYAGRLAPQAIDREAIQTQGQPPPDEDRLIVTPLPRFMYSHRALWYPRSPHTDYATADLRLTVPAEYQIVASGTLAGTAIAPAGAESGAGRSLRTVEYRTDRPVRYLACVISRFVPVGTATAQAGGTSVPIEVVATARMAGRNRQTADRAAAILAYYGRLLGDVPYPTMTIAALDDNLPGGHSPAYFAALHQPLPTTPYNWAGDPVAFDNEHAPFFLAHEIAHQWWGQAVGWRNYREQWLSEGLAQYFAALYAGEDRGPAMLDALLTQMRASSETFFSRGPIALGYRLGHLEDDSRVFRALVYNKSAVVLHMLRRLVGDEAFFAGLRQYYMTMRFKPAGTDDLRRAMEAAAGHDLRRFFDGWIRGFGRPRVRLTWTHDAASGSAAIRVEQVGDAYAFPLTVSIQYEDGRTELRTLRVLESAHEERVATASAIRRVTARDPLTYFDSAR